MAGTAEQGAGVTGYCPDCGSQFRMAWLMGDPPEPYGEVCDCPEVVAEMAEARAEKRAMDNSSRAALDSPDAP